MSGSVDPRLFEYYESAFSEADRLTSREGRLEFVRTKELLTRVLPDPPASVLDVGAERASMPRGWPRWGTTSICAAALDGFVKGWLWERGSEAMEQMTRFGKVDRDRSGFGVISYFRLPEDARSELAAAGLEVFELVGVEGLAWIAADFDRRWDSEEGRALMLSAARAVEQVPELQVLSAHLLALRAVRSVDASRLAG